MGHEQDGRPGALPERDEIVSERKALRLVERSERLVHQQRPRRHGKRPREPDALPHPAGELRRMTVGRVSEADGLELGQRSRLRLTPSQPAGELEPELDVTERREPREERRVLEDDHTIGTRRADRPAVDLDAASGRPKQAGHEAQKGGLAAARGAGEGDELPGPDRERDLVEDARRDLLAPRPLHEGKRQLVELDHLIAPRGQRYSAPVSGLAASFRAFTRLARDLRPFLASPLDDASAAPILQAHLAERAEAFARLLDIAAVRRPGSPLARLLTHGGVVEGDLVASVRAQGLETTLSQLHAAGVRLTLAEMRGRVPIVRGSLEIQAVPEDFENPLLTGTFDVRSGGSTGARNRAAFDLASVTDDAVHWSLFRQSFELERRPLASWYPGPPGIAGIKGVLLAAKVGDPAARWFSQTPLRWSRNELRYVVLTRYLALASRGAVPHPEHVPPERVGHVVGWLAGHVAAGRAPVLMCTPSSATRVCEAAQRGGANIQGTFFRCGGEPYTDAKDVAIRAAGCTAATNYYASELGAIGIACADPVSTGEVHVCDDRLALIEVPSSVASEAIMVLAGTTLSPTSSTLVINLELDDYATVDHRSCGCLLEQVGLTKHLRQIRSHAKLTVEGMHFLGDEIVTLVEQELPRRFGGGPTSYQLVEEESGDGRSRVLVLVAPAVGPVDEAEVVEAVLTGLAAGGTAQRMMADVWRRAGTVVLVRREPAMTAASKVPSLVRAAG